MKTKMRGHLKRVGRCPVPGHGQQCCVTSEIRENEISRAQEKRQARREIEDQTQSCELFKSK